MSLSEVFSDFAYCFSLMAFSLSENNSNSFFLFASIT